jgi:uncharacterized membrane protein
MATPQWVVVTALILVGLALRIPGLFTDFWMDEIWSWTIAGQCRSLADVVLSDASHIDNNHPIATMFMYLFGQNQAAWVYRLPSLVAGIASVGMAARMMRRVGNVEACLATILFSLNYLLIFYSSEARGYTFVVFFTLLSFDLLNRCLEQPAQRSYGLEAFFGACCCMGFVSHLMFVTAYTAALAWSLVRVRQLEPTTGRRLARLARLHALPSVFVVLFYHVFMWNMVEGGGPSTPGRVVLLKSLSLTLGGPAEGLFAVVAAMIVAGLFLLGLFVKENSERSIWVYYLFSIVIAPALMCIRGVYFNAKPQPLMLRYFLISISMFLLLICPLLGQWWRSGRHGRQGVMLFVAMYTAANLWHVNNFWILGRGHYSQALAQIAAQTPSGSIQLCANAAPRTEMLLGFYRSRACPGRQVTVSEEPTRWFIRDRFDAAPPPLATFKGKSYLLTRVYPSIDLSGWYWEVYRADQTR